MKKEALRANSKRDWLIALVYLVFAIGLTVVWVIPYNSATSYVLLTKIVGTSIIGIVTLLFTWAVFSTYYLLTDDYLACISGTFASRIFYSDIKDIKKTCNVWASLALSFDRVAISYGKKGSRKAFISPKYRDLFIEELKKKVESKKNNIENNK